MNDDRVVAYLRGRGQVQPPADLVARVVAAVDAAPVRSPFAAFLPAAAVAGALAILVLVAVLVGQGVEIGPSPSDSAQPKRSDATVEELRAAVESGIAALRDTPGVEGRTTASVLGELSNATWFTWRPSGDQAVVLRTDVDVAQTAWWLEPEAGPPARGRNVSTTMFVFVGDDAFMTNADAWLASGRADAPPSVTLATGLLDGVIDVGEVMLGVTDGEVTVMRQPDGVATWSLSGPYADGTATTEWVIAADGTLRSWSHELSDVTPSLDEAPFITSQRTEFTPLVDPAPIEPPNTESPPDPASLGVPADFPLGTRR